MGENIKKYRLKKGLSQQVLADRSILSYEYICRVEKGQKFISLRSLFRIADALEIKMSDLINFD